MTRLLKSIGCPCLAAALLAAWAPLANSAPPTGLHRVEMDASRLRIDFPHLFKSERGTGDDPLAFLFAGPSAQALSSSPARSACELSASSLCYDLASRHIVYRPARQYMPKIDGLTAESVSLRRHSIGLRYSFR